MHVTSRVYRESPGANSHLRICFQLLLSYFLNRYNNYRYLMPTVIKSDRGHESLLSRGPSVPRAIPTGLGGDSPPGVGDDVVGRAEVQRNQKSFWFFFHRKRTSFYPLFLNAAAMPLIEMCTPRRTRSLTSISLSWAAR